jgi:hypothetical protein
MRTCRFYFSSVALCCLFISLNTYAQLQKIYLHPKAPGTEKQSRFVDSIRFIPLQVNEGVQIGGYNYIIITKNSFLVVDYPSKTVFVYSKTGAFVNKINYKKLGEEFYPSYREQTDQLVFFGNNKNYTLTPKDRIKVLLDWENPHNKKYFRKYTIDLNDPAFAIKREAPSKNDIVRAYPLFEEYYMQTQISTSTLFKDSMDYEFKIYRNNELVKSFFPYNRIDEPKFLYSNETVALNRIGLSNAYFITRPYCDTIYKMVRDSVTPAYQLVLPLENSLPTSFFNKSFKNKTERENFRRNNAWMLHQVYTFDESPNFIYVSVRYLSNYESYIYLKQSNTTYKIKNIKPDASQYNMQLLADGGLIRNGDRFYKTQKAADLIQFFEQHKEVAVPKELEQFLKSKPDNAAPVLVEFKLKN